MRVASVGLVRPAVAFSPESAALGDRVRRGVGGGDGSVPLDIIAQGAPDHRRSVGERKRYGGEEDSAQKAQSIILCLIA